MHQTCKQIFCEMIVNEAPEGTTAIREKQLSAGSCNLSRKWNWNIKDSTLNSVNPFVKRLRNKFLQRILWSFIIQIKSDK